MRPSSPPPFLRLLNPNGVEASLLPAIIPLLPAIIPVTMAEKFDGERYQSDMFVH